MFGLFRRFIEFFFVRMDKLTKPSPHLQHLELSTLLESFGKERRLRAFSRQAYYQILRKNGEVVDEAVHPPVPPEAGHFADVSYRTFYQDLRTYWAQATELGTPTSGPSWYDPGVPAAKASGVKRQRSPSVEPVTEVEISMNTSPFTLVPMSIEPAKPSSSRPTKQPKAKAPPKVKMYDTSVQVRGRPRKYIHVVKPDGSIDRHIIGSIPPHPDLEAIYIYLPDRDVLVPGPPAYTGLGAPPPVTPEMLEKAVTPGHFDGYVRADGSTMSKKRKSETRKTESTSKGKKKGKVPDQPGDDNVVEADTDNGDRISKRPRRSTAKTVTSYADIAPDEVERSAEPEGSVREVPRNDEATRRATTPPIDPALFGTTPAIPVQEFVSKSFTEEAEASARVATETSMDAETVQASDPPPAQPASAIATKIPPLVAAVLDGQSTPTEPIAAPHVQSNSGPSAVQKAADRLALPENGPTIEQRPADAHVLDRQLSLDVQPSIGWTVIHQPGTSNSAPPPLLPAATDTTPALTATAITAASSPPARPSPPPPSSPVVETATTSKVGSAAAPLFAEHEEDVHSDTDQPTAEHRASSTLAGTQATDPDATGAASLVPIRPVQVARKGKRLDLGAVRRANEMLTVLQELGGVREEHDLWNYHREWSFRVAGTDAPNAPVKGATMDRSVWKRIIESTKDDGRISMTISSMPTSSGTWTKYKVIWLVDTPQERRNEYLRNLANNVKVLTQPRDSLVTSTLPDLAYTEIRLPNRHPSSTVQHTSMRELDKVSQTLAGDARRDELLKDPLILSQLFGRQSGKMLRTHILHRAIRTAINSPQSQAVMSTVYGAFTVNLLSEDISAGAWYSTVMTHERNDELLAWLQVPENRERRLKDVPFDVRVTNHSRRQRIRLKIRTHIEMLTALGIISPILLCDPSEAEMIVEKPHSTHSHFKVVAKKEAPESLRYLVMHDYAPVWHIAAREAVILGYLPIRTDEEIERYWDVQRKASLHYEAPQIPELLDRPPSDVRSVSRSIDTLDITNEASTGMQQAARWRNDVRLLPVQKSAMNEAIDWASGTTRLSDPKQMEAFAWEYAIPIEVVQEEVIGRLEKAVAKAAKRMEDATQRAEQQRTRHAKAQKALAAKLAERQAASKRQWESRVSAACQRAGVEFTMDLLTYVSKQGLTALTRGNLTDDKIDDMIRYFMSSRYQGIVQEKRQAKTQAGRDGMGEQDETQGHAVAPIPPLQLHVLEIPAPKKRGPKPSKREKIVRRRFTAIISSLVACANGLTQLAELDTDESGPPKTTS